MIPPSVKIAIVTFVWVIVWKLVRANIALRFKMIPAASVQTIIVTDATIIISMVFACVTPASVITVQSVQRWRSVVIVNSCIV